MSGKESRRKEDVQPWGGVGWGGGVQLGKKAREQGRARTRVRRVRHSPKGKISGGAPNLCNQDKSYFNIVTDFSFYPKLQ